MYGVDRLLPPSKWRAIVHRLDAHESTAQSTAQPRALFSKDPERAIAQST